MRTCVGRCRISEILSSLAGLVEIPALRSGQRHRPGLVRLMRQPLDRLEDSAAGEVTAAKMNPATPADRRAEAEGRMAQPSARFAEHIHADKTLPEETESDGMTRRVARVFA